MAIEMTCPTCGSHHISKNGTSHREKQHYKCRDCGCQFVEDPQWRAKPKETKALVNRLLHEKFPLAGIAQATETSESWVQGQVNATYAAVSKTPEVSPKPQGPLRVKMDELWLFVDNKKNQQWAWLAMDAESRDIISRHLLAVTSEIVLGNRRSPSGSHFHRSTDNAPRFTPTVGKLMLR